MSVPEFASQGRNNGLKSRLNMRLVTENALRSHSQPRLGAIVSWALKKIREVSVILYIYRIHKDSGDLIFFYIHLNQPFEPRPCLYNSNEFYTRLSLQRLI